MLLRTLVKGTWTTCGPHASLCVLTPFCAVFTVAAAACCGMLCALLWSLVPHCMHCSRAPADWQPEHAVVILVAAVGQAAAAPGADWVQYFRLFDESRFVHVTSLDFAALTLFCPFWMWNDAQRRGWAARCGTQSLLSPGCFGACVCMWSAVQRRGRAAPRDSQSVLACKEFGQSSAKCFCCCSDVLTSFQVCSADCLLVAMADW